MIEEEEKKTVELPECGRRLRRTREQMGLSVDDVASELRLSSFQIRALEDDDWSQLPGTTYARGYLKAYARLLGLDAEQMLAGASTEEIEISRAEPAMEPGAADEDDSRSEPPASRLRWGWVAGIALIGALVAAGWQLKGRLQWVPGLVEGEIASLGVGSEQHQSGAVPTGAGAGQATAASNAVDATAGTEAEAEAAANAEAVGAGAGRSDQPPTPTVPTKVVFQFDQSSWVEVRDAKGKRLVYRSFEAGRRIEVDGQPPFHVFLGNAAGVKVEYLGQVSTRDADPGRLYARFVLGASSG